MPLHDDQESVELLLLGSSGTVVQGAPENLHLLMHYSFHTEGVARYLSHTPQGIDQQRSKLLGGETQGRSRHSLSQQVCVKAGEKFIHLADRWILDVEGITRIGVFGCQFEALHAPMFGAVEQCFFYSSEGGDLRSVAADDLSNPLHQGRLEEFLLAIRKEAVQNWSMHFGALRNVSDGGFGVSKSEKDTYRDLQDMASPHIRIMSALLGHLPPWPLEYETERWNAADDFVWSSHSSSFVINSSGFCL